MSSPLNGMPVIVRTYGAVYLRLPQALREPINGGCSCDYCKAHPNETPSWDTLCVPKPTSNVSDHAHTVHMPDPPLTFQQYMDRKRKGHREKDMTPPTSKGATQ